jgi:hypothetical protein
VPWLHHYTSRSNAQEIANLGHLMPGVSGGVYVTPDLYDQGAAALDRLSIPSTSPEVVLIWSAEYGELNLDERDISEVEPLRIEGRLVRRGGGAEMHVPGRVDVTDARILLLRSP